MRTAVGAVATYSQHPYSVSYDPDAADAPQHQALLDWWNRQRGEYKAPLRQALDPINLRRHLRALVLMESVDDGADFHYRLIGTSVVEAFGRDSTGSTVATLYAKDAELRDTLLEICRTVALRSVPARAFGDLRTVDRPYRKVDSLYLPLAREDGQIGWVLNQVLFD